MKETVWIIAIFPRTESVLELNAKKEKFLVKYYKLLLELAEIYLSLVPKFTSDEKFPRVDSCEAEPAL